MTTITLTPEQLQVVEQAGDQPVRVEDPRNHRTYLLVEEAAQGRAPRRLRRGEPGMTTSPRASSARRTRSSAISPSC